jgi:hypothetical protein
MGETMTTPHFLQALELDVSADERAIRRAYAGKLKKIDQEADPAAFQALRAAYDAALNWSRYATRPGRDKADQTAAETAAETTTETAEAVDDPRSLTARSKMDPMPLRHRGKPTRAYPKVERASDEQIDFIERAPDPIALAAAALGDFLGAFRSEVTTGPSGVDRQLWQTKLEQVLAGDTLVNIAARDAFEFRYASLLTQGWKPGHEVLFAIAANAFNWDDRKRLKGLGHVGNIVDRAMLERAMYDRQTVNERIAQRKVIQRLRDPAAPSRQEVVLSYVRVQQVVQRFPTWLGMITDVQSFERWREAQAALPAHLLRRSKAAGQTVRMTRASKFRRMAWAVVLTVVAIALANTSHSPSQNLTPAQMTQAQQNARAAMLQIFDARPPMQMVPPRSLQAQPVTGK